MHKHARTPRTITDTHRPGTAVSSPGSSRDATLSRRRTSQNASKENRERKETRPYSAKKRAISSEIIGDRSAKNKQAGSSGQARDRASSGLRGQAESQQLRLRRRQLFIETRRSSLRAVACVIRHGAEDRSTASRTHTGDTSPGPCVGQRTVARQARDVVAGTTAKRRPRRHGGIRSRSQRNVDDDDVDRRPAPTTTTAKK